MASPNPGTKPAVEVSRTDRSEFQRIPMSAPRLKLQHPDIPGYHTHWMLEENVPAAFQGGYEMVKADEVQLNPMGIGSGIEGGNADMGTNISIIGNKNSGGGKPEMQYLMKIKLEWWNADQKALEQHNIGMLAQIFRGEKIAGQSAQGPDARNRYVDQERTGIAKPLFNRPARKGKV
jgi:hypothetical protein